MPLCSASGTSCRTPASGRRPRPRWGCKHLRTCARADAPRDRAAAVGCGERAGGAGRRCPRLRCPEAATRDRRAVRLHPGRGKRWCARSSGGGGDDDDSSKGRCVRPAAASLTWALPLSHTQNSLSCRLSSVSSIWQCTCAQQVGSAYLAELRPAVGCLVEEAALCWLSLSSPAHPGCIRWPRGRTRR